MSGVWFLILSALVSFGFGTTHSQLRPMDNGGGPAVAIATPAPVDNGGGPAAASLDNGGGPFATMGDNGGGPATP